MAKRERQESISTAGGVSPSTNNDQRAAHTPKYASLEPEQRTSSTMRCYLPPHKPLSFTTYDDYESHYTQAHTNRCTECRKNFPTAHFLDLHITENHDPITASRRDAGEKVFACFVEGCEKVCADWKKRRSHLVDKHGYPRNYDFFVVNSGVDGRRSMLRPGVDADGHRKSSRERRGSSVTEGSRSTEATSLSEQAGGEVEKDEGDGHGGDGHSRGSSAGSASKDVVISTTAKGGAVDDLAASMSALKMVPRSITFGKRTGRSGFAKS